MNLSWCFAWFFGGATAVVLNASRDNGFNCGVLDTESIEHTVCKSMDSLVSKIMARNIQLGNWPNQLAFKVIKNFGAGSNGVNLLINTFERLHTTQRPILPNSPPDAKELILKIQRQTSVVPGGKAVRDALRARHSSFYDGDRMVSSRGTFKATFVNFEIQNGFNVAEPITVAEHDAILVRTYPLQCGIDLSAYFKLLDDVPIESWAGLGRTGQVEGISGVFTGIATKQHVHFLMKVYLRYIQIYRTMGLNFVQHGDLHPGNIYLSLPSGLRHGACVNSLGENRKHYGLGFENRQAAVLEAINGGINAVKLKLIDLDMMVGLDKVDFNYDYSHTEYNFKAKSYGWSTVCERFLSYHTAEPTVGVPDVSPAERTSYCDGCLKAYFEMDTAKWDNAKEDVVKNSDTWYTNEGCHFIFTRLNSVEPYLEVPWGTYRRGVSPTALAVVAPTKISDLQTEGLFDNFDFDVVEPL